MAYTLKQARAVCDLSRREAALKIGVSENTLFNWETRKSYPGLIYIPKILAAYQLQSIDDLIFFDAKD